MALGQSTQTRDIKWVSGKEGANILSNAKVSRAGGELSQLPRLRNAFSLCSVFLGVQDKDTQSTDCQWHNRTAGLLTSNFTLRPWHTRVVFGRLALSGDNAFLVAQSQFGVSRILGRDTPYLAFHGRFNMLSRQKYGHKLSGQETTLISCSASETEVRDVNKRLKKAQDSS